MSLRTEILELLRQARERDDRSPYPSKTSGLRTSEIREKLLHFDGRRKLGPDPSTIRRHCQALKSRGQIRNVGFHYEYTWRFITDDDRVWELSSDSRRIESSSLRAELSSILAVPIHSINVNADEDDCVIDMDLAMARKLIHAIKHTRVGASHAPDNSTLKRAEARLADVGDYCVMLSRIGDKLVLAIKVVRDIRRDAGFSYSLPECRSLIDSVRSSGMHKPVLIISGVSEQAAFDAKKSLENAGCSVVIEAY